MPPPSRPRYRPQVEDAFAAGQLSRVAELLAAMGRSLDVVGGVPEFAQGRERLRALQVRPPGALRACEGGRAWLRVCRAA